MISHTRLIKLLATSLILIAGITGFIGVMTGPAASQSEPPAMQTAGAAPGDQSTMKPHLTQAERQAAADRAKAAGLTSMDPMLAVVSGPDYFGTTPNYANSQLPATDAGVIANDHFWPWYDSVSMQNWVLMASPAASSFIHFDLSIAGSAKTLADPFGMGAGVVPGGKTLTYISPGLVGGPVKSTASGAGEGIVSQRSLLGNSFEELPGTEVKQSDHLYFSWYDEQSAGFKNWVLVNNPSATETVHVVISFTDAGTGLPEILGESDVAPESSWTPHFSGKKGGPVEVKASLLGSTWPTNSRPVNATQRTLSNFDTAFNEVPGVPASELSNDYMWTWYDQQTSGFTDWVLIANPGVDHTGATQGTVTATVKIGAATYGPYSIDPGKNVTPTFPGAMGGPVEVTSSGGDVIASQRVLAGPSFEEVYGTPKSTLSNSYQWTWYDEMTAGVTNWVLIANMDPANAVGYSVKIAGVVQPCPSGGCLIPVGGKVTPTFPGQMNGPVEVTASGTIIASQRVMWNGYFNEVRGVGAVVSGSGIRKFVDSMPGLGFTNANDLGQYLPVAVADTTTYPVTVNQPASDYYEIALVQYTQQMHKDLPVTTLRGYVQIETPANAVGMGSQHIALTYPDSSPILNASSQPVYAVDKPSYMGPTIVAQRDRPVRVKFSNYLPTGSGGDLFLPVDTTLMGAGQGPQGSVYSIALTGGGSGYTSAPDVSFTGGGGAGATATALVDSVTQTVTSITVTNGGEGYTSAPNVVIANGGGSGSTATSAIVGAPGASYGQNRATLHLHGGATPWISDGTPNQWITPAGDTTAYPKGVSVQNVPDMPDPGDGSQTFFYTNEQSAKLMFYHDHSMGITRLNVYAGEAAPYLLNEPVEQALVTAGTIPSDQIPLVIQDKTFVPDDAQLNAEDPTWDKTKWGGAGNLWLPHVYMPNQNPYDASGANAMGRWDYGPWFWPPFTGLQNGPVANPYYDPITRPWEPPQIPGTPTPTVLPEAFMDTPVVNGTAYPFTKVGQKAYRFRILNASNDRFLNLQLYYAKSATPDATDPATGMPALQKASGEVAMVPAIPNTGLPATWPTDGRNGGVPDPAAAGPKMIQIGSEGGILPAPAVLDNTPVGYNYNRRDIVVLNVENKTLFLGPAERADVIIDFSQVPDGAKLLLYNDSPAPVPASDARIDYYTGNPDMLSTGGAPSTMAGYGPDTRTMLQFQVTSSLGTAPAFNLAGLQTALPAAFAASQDAPIIPQDPYNAAYNANYPTDAYGRIQDNSISLFNGPLTGLTLINGGVGYTAAPAVSITGGSGTGATATAALTPTSLASIAVTSGGSGYTSTPTVDITNGGGTGATATAILTSGVVTGITVTNGGSGFTSAPTVAITNGGGTGATATATLTPTSVASVTLTNGGTGFKSAPVVGFSGGGGAGAAATASGLTIDFQAKSIIEDFDPVYGRMNALLGVEIAHTNNTNQTSIIQRYIDPSTEIINNSDTAQPIGSAADGTQVWKITHNGVDTHAIHFHLFNVQLINRVGWDGAIRPPDANEVGWKETVRMNPLEDVIVAMRPVAPTLPASFGPLPDSIRPLDVTMPIGSTVGFTNVDKLANPVTVTNQMTNFGWEYVWHCHLLGHEENDMMRPIQFLFKPAAPSELAAAQTAPTTVTVDWMNNAVAPAVTTFRIQRATDAAFTANVTEFTVAAPAVTYNDTTVVVATTYFYRVRAENSTGVSAWSASAAVPVA